MSTMTVYIEYAFLDNFIIDYTLLKLSLVLSRHKVKFWWLLFCAFLCAVFAIVLPVLNLPILIKSIIKIVFSLLIVYVSCEQKTLKEYLKLYFLFMLITFAFGGVLQGVFTLFSLPYDNVYLIWLVVICVKILAVITKSLIKSIKKNFATEKFRYNCTVKVGEKLKNCQGFYDTGNGVFDNDTGKGVVICSKTFAYNLLGTSNFEKYISIKTVTGERQVGCFTVETLSVDNIEYTNVLFAVSPTQIVGSELLLHCDYSGGENV